MQEGGDDQFARPCADDARAYPAARGPLNRRRLDDDLPWTTKDEALDVLRRLRGDGVRLAVGTDCGIDGVSHADHLWGLRTLVASGMTAAEAFAAATETGAGLRTGRGGGVADGSPCGRTPGTASTC
jgi:hypothetical protein